MFENMDLTVKKLQITRIFKKIIKINKKWCISTKITQKKTPSTSTFQNYVSNPANDPADHPDH